MSTNKACARLNSLVLPNSTSKLYKTLKLPHRFPISDSFSGYGVERHANSIHYTSNSEYGKFAPTIYDVPLRFYPQSHHFSRLMFITKRRNLSLNGN